MHVVRDSQPLFLFLSSRILSLKKFFRRILIFFGEKTHVAKTKNKQTANSFVFAPFRVRRSGHQQQRATFRLNGGWRPFQPRKKSTKKKIRRRASLLLRYSWTRKRRRQPTHNNKKKKKVSLLPTHQTRKKEELVNKRIVVVVAVVSCAKTFWSCLWFQKKV